MAQLAGFDLGFLCRVRLDELMKFEFIAPEAPNIKRAK
jgi:hypothetical protein